MMRPVYCSLVIQLPQDTYLLGQNVKETDVNPFQKNTNNWYNWNRGKNENLLNKTQCKDNQ